MSDPDPGVVAPPAEPVAPATPAPTEPNGSEAVINPGKSEEQAVPFTRFQEVNDKAKAAEERAAQLESDLASLKEQQSQTPQNEEEVDPDVVDLVKKSAGKLGFVTKEELDAREAQIQVRTDVNDLTSQYKDSGIPFDGKAVIDYAKANGMPLGSKKSLDAVYKEMNYDAIIEAQRKAAVASFQEGTKSGAEKPGSKGAQPPEDQKPASLKDRIKQAREKAGATFA
jgi:hypothetical protein